MSSGSGDPTALNFDTAATPTTLLTASGVTCAACQRALDTAYFDINGLSVCEACRDVVARQAQTPRDWATLAKAAAFGVGAAIAGAALYYAVIKITNLEIGLVAIAIGYMVGYSVKRATNGRGGRRFQVLALALTYWAVGLAYLPLTLEAVLERAAADARTTTAASSATTTSAPGAAPVPQADTAADGDDDSGPLMSVLVAMVFSLGLPVLSVFGSMPSGLISGAIIAFGMHQAWQMTAAPHLRVSGPYRIGTGEVRG